MSAASNVAYILRSDEFIFAFAATQDSVYFLEVRKLPVCQIYAYGLQTFSGGHCRSFLISWQTLLIWVALSARRRRRRYCSGRPLRNRKWPQMHDSTFSWYKTFIQVALNLCKYILTLKLSGFRTSTLYLLLSYKISAINGKCDILFYEWDVHTRNPGTVWHTKRRKEERGCKSQVWRALRRRCTHTFCALRSCISKKTWCSFSGHSHNEFRQ